MDIYTYRYPRLAYDDGLLRSSLRGGEIEIASKLDREDLANGSTFVNVPVEIFLAGRKRKKCPVEKKSMKDVFFLSLSKNEA